MKFSLPQIDHVLHQLASISNWIDHSIYEKLKAVFQAMSCVSPEGDNKVRSLWIEVPRGNIEDFGDYEEFREEGLVKSHEDFTRYWMEEYPVDSKWCQFTSAQYQTKRFFYIDSKLVLSIDDTEEPARKEMYDINHLYNFLDWLKERIEHEASAIKKDADAYNGYLERDLSYHKRKGKIGRRKYWDIIGDDAVRLDQCLGMHRINTLQNLVDEQEHCENSATIKEISAADSFTYCEICYDANKYFSDPEKILSPVEK